MFRHGHDAVENAANLEGLLLNYVNTNRVASFSDIAAAMSKATGRKISVYTASNLAYFLFDQNKVEIRNRGNGYAKLVLPKGGAV